MSKKSKVQFNSLNTSSEKLEIGKKNEGNVYGVDQVNKKRSLGSSMSERRNLLTLNNQVENDAYKDSVVQLKLNKSS